MKKIMLLTPALFFLGCAELGYAIFGVGVYESEPFRKKNQNEVWGALQEVVNNHFNIRLADDSEKYLETEWNEHLGPMYKMGRRLRVRAWVVAEDDTGDPIIEIAVDREINTNFESPLSKGQADWEIDVDAGGRDQAREIAFAQGVRRILYEIKPSDAILNPKASEYRRDPRDARKEELWGDPKSPRAQGGPGGSGDLWGGARQSGTPGKDLWR